MKLKTLILLSVVAVAASLSTAAQAQTFSVIHTFTGVDGENPSAGVTLKNGVLYGTVYGALYAGKGGVYQVARQGNNWVTTPIYFFIGPDGSEPQARVVFGPDGHLYGTTAFGGAHGQGTVFRLIPNPTLCKAAKCFPWKEDALYSFSGLDGDYVGYGDIIWDQQNNIYGTTLFGGFYQGPYFGNVYQLTPSGNGWTGASIYLFPNQGTDARSPYGGLTFDQNGNLWGTTNEGGDNNQGAIFEMTYSVGLGWQEKVVYSFNRATDGALPIGGLISDAAGNFYGTTTQFGAAGGGTVFELSPSGNTWTFKVLYNFSGDQDGPYATLAMDAAGNLYGTTNGEGAHGFGNIFKLTNTGNGWTYASLYDFTGGSDGRFPISNVTIDSDGTLYGTASEGGSFAGPCQENGCGVVWMIKP